jgi:hypothetical protein
MYIWIHDDFGETMLTPRFSKVLYIWIHLRCEIERIKQSHYIFHKSYALSFNKITVSNSPKLYT